MEFIGWDPLTALKPTVVELSDATLPTTTPVVTPIDAFPEPINSNIYPTMTARPIFRVSPGVSNTAITSIAPFSDPIIVLVSIVTVRIVPDKSKGPEENGEETSFVANLNELVMYQGSPVRIKLIQQAVFTISDQLFTATKISSGAFRIASSTIRAGKETMTLARAVITAFDEGVIIASIPNHAATTAYEGSDNVDDNCAGQCSRRSTKSDQTSHRSGFERVTYPKPSYLIATYISTLLFDFGGFIV